MQFHKGSALNLVNSYFRLDSVNNKKMLFVLANKKGKMQVNNAAAQCHMGITLNTLALFSK